MLRLIPLRLLSGVLDRLLGKDSHQTEHNAELQRHFIFQSKMSIKSSIIRKLGIMLAACSV